MKIHDALNALVAEEYQTLSLSQKAVLLVRSVPGVTSVLVGMRSEEYVEDVVFGLQAKPVEHVEEIWSRLATVKEEA
jgi:aryl-alcohol dehydrogenase-like predicted oxidoreductase